MTPERKCAEAAARKAGELILQRTETLQIMNKGSNYNLVTDADLLSQKTIVDYIKTTFPDDAIFGEENDTPRPPLDAERLWIIDPIDGTTNYAHRIPHFSISIAFAKKGTVECGVIFDPSMNELFSAERSGGAWCNSTPIFVSKVASLTQSVIATGFYYERGVLMHKTLDTIERLLTANIQGIRRMGSAALDLCYVACGRYDGYFEYRLSPWDFAAGILIVEEAGGICLDSDGSRKGLQSLGCITCTSTLAEEFVPMVQWVDMAHKPG